LRVRTALLVASFIIAYFLGLTYAMLRADTYYGVEYSAFLVLVAAVLGILAVKYTTRFAAPFLVLFNASRIFLFGFWAVYSLSVFGIIRWPLGNVSSGSLILSLGVYAILNKAYAVGFQRPEAETRLILLG
jgi:hypothetical protein